MDGEIKEFLTECPRCGKLVDAEWSVCPQCGLRMKPAEQLLLRSVMWGAALLAFVLFDVAIAKADSRLAVWFSILIGLPLAYTFGKAVVFRLRGRPLSLGQLGKTGLVAFAGFTLLAIVVPFLVGMALLLLLFVMCAAALGVGAFQ